MTTAVCITDSMLPDETDGAPIVVGPDPLLCEGPSRDVAGCEFYIFETDPFVDELSLSVLKQHHTTWVKIDTFDNPGGMSCGQIEQLRQISPQIPVVALPSRYCGDAQSG